MTTKIAERRANLSAAKRALLEKRLRGELKSVGPQPIAKRPQGDPARLSFAQERLWFLSRLEPDSPAYNMVNVIELQGQLDVEALEQSFNAVVHRHEALRTNFSIVDKQPAQVIDAAIELKVTVTDLQHLAASERVTEIDSWVVVEARRPFDLAQGSLARLTLLKLGAENHVLLFTVHHIVFDEWSNELFWREMSAFYQGVVNDQSVTLPGLPLQYADFAHWQKQRLQEGVFETQLNYWRGQLAGNLPLLQLPTDYPRPPVQRFEGALAFLELPAPLTTALRSISQQAETTMFMTLLAAFKTLLFRYTGQTDLIVGTPIANRNRAEIKDLIGLFLNTLALRSNLADDMTFMDFLAQVRQTALDAYAHQDLPFEKLVDELRPRRDLSYNPIFQVMFVYQKDIVDDFDLPGLTPTRRFIDAGVAKFDLTLFVNETEQNLTAAIEYNTDLFSAETINRMLAHLQTLLAGIAADPYSPLAKLPLLTATEHHQLLVEWNDTTADYPRSFGIHQLIDNQVSQKPNQIAIKFEDTQLTYADLMHQADRLAHQLQAQGVGPNVPVGLCLERSPEMIVAILGVLKAGGAYVPLDPTYPAERLAFMIADTQMPLILTQTRLINTLSAHQAQIFCLDGDWSLSGTQLASSDRADVAVNEEIYNEVAYIIYTSGSTGQPKGVQITHRNLVHSTQARLDYYVEPVEAFLLLSSFAFDSSIVGIFGTLCAGGTLVLPQPRQEQDVDQVAELINRHQISHTLCLPSLYNLILTYADTDKLQSLQAVMVAGEACPSDLIERHYGVLPYTTLYNEYGPTEGTVWSTVYKIPTTETGQSVPIGRPIANMELYILDAHQQPVPIGIPGELYIGGAGLAKGYLNRPELTAEKFIRHPFSDDPQARLYKTGDLGRFQPDGNIEFLGRVDNQVKIRGYRIELGEVETALDQHPTVQNSVVVVRETNASPPEHQHQEDAASGEDIQLLLSLITSLDEDRTNKLLAEIEALSENEIETILSYELRED